MGSRPLHPWSRLDLLACALGLRAATDGPYRTTRVRAYPFVVGLDPLRSGRDSPDGLASAIRAKRQSRRFYSSAGGFAVCTAMVTGLCGSIVKVPKTNPRRRMLAWSDRGVRALSPLRFDTPRQCSLNPKPASYGEKGKAVGLHPGGFAVCA
jgi:hypothetical protein